MKKLLFCAAALAALLFAGSCQKENLEPEKGGNTVSFTVSAPGQIQTKAIADGMNVDVLHYEVYSRMKDAPNHLEDYSHKPLVKGYVGMKEETDPNTGKVLNTATVDLDLIKDQDLTIIFWAQKKEMGFYNVTTDGSTDLRRISFNPNMKRLANVEDRAAFFKRLDFNTRGNNNYEVELVRPFAQINLGTTEESLNPTQQSQIAGYSIEVLESTMTIKGISTTFNTVKGVAESDNLVDVTFESNATPYQQTKNNGNEVEVLTVQNKDFHYVSMNYLFVPAGEKLVEVSYTVKTDKGDIQNTIKNVPVKQNFRTNIIGNLLTQKTKFDIVVDEEFNKPDIDLGYVADGLVQVNPDLNATAPYKKMYEISSANGFAYAMMEIVDNMKAGESAEFYLISSIDMNGINYVPPTVKTGVDVLLATGAAPMTRAASEITISGLDSPVFEKVANGAVVTFSDIVVEDHESDAALVNEVETGADVVVNNCSASDSADKDVDLIGTGEMVDIIKDGVSTLEQLQAALRTSANPVRVNAALTIAAGQDIVLDLNGKLVQYVLEPDKTDIMFRVNGKLTITGNGQINSNHYIASANQGGEIIVENGGFTGNTTCFQANGGKVYIHGGNFEVTGNNGSTYLLNHIDSMKEIGRIEVSGGTFYGYNPAESKSENPAMNFVAKEYVSVKMKDNVWTVRPDLYKEGKTYFAYTSNGFQKALKLNEPYVEITLVDDVTVDVDAWNRMAFGGDKSETIMIYGKGMTITFNQVNSDWNNIATNNNAKLIINNAYITSTGYNDGPWNRHDLNFACDVELDFVTSDKAIALKAGGTLTKVDINDKNTSDTYALWIQPNGQTVTLDGCTIDMIDCSDGRGIKIDEQYVDNPGRVTLNVSNTTFKTEEKAAILVKSKAGADINLNDITISEVKADSKNAVWVDEASADYYDKVIVTGGTKIQEK